MIYINSKHKIRYKKSREVDVVFIYEIKKREIQGLSLIGYELIRRGYTVGYINTWHGSHHDDIRYKAKVAVVFAAYNTEVIDFALSFIDSCKNVLNMQWEELLNDNCLLNDNIYMMKGNANNVYHISWGDANRNHLVNICGIPSDHVKVTGHVGMDFLRKGFNGYYKSKEDLLDEFNMNPNNDCILFISSFAPPNLLEESFAEVSVKSQYEISKWLIRYAEENPNCYVIYRPHPIEVLSDQLRKSFGRYRNIRIISEYSVQQWIKVADYIMNWWSTSLCDIYVAGKTCVFLRPYDIPDKDEYHMFKNISMAHTYEEMLNKMMFHDVVIEREEIEKYYLFDDKEPVYEKIANLIEQIYSFTEGIDFNNSHKKRIRERGLILEARELYGYIIYSIFDFLTGNKSCAEASYHRNKSKENYVSEREIVGIMNKIDDLLSAQKTIRSRG